MRASQLILSFGLIIAPQEKINWDASLVVEKILKKQLEHKEHE